MSDSAELFPQRRTTKLPGGYMGKILRVNLTSGSMKDENLPEEPLLRKLIGGQALATYILLKELPTDAKPFGPENKVVLMTGPNVSPPAAIANAVADATGVRLFDLPITSEKIYKALQGKTA